jgi:hypothetical protein
MYLRYFNILCLVGAALICSRCSSLERDNSLDPKHPGKAGEEASLSMFLPLPKPLVIVVHRVVATLTGPGIQTVVKELALSPLGPATGTIGALPPATGLTLTLEGFDLDGALLFQGVERNISITGGNTTQVNIELILVQDIPDDTPEPPAEEPPAEEPPAEEPPAEEPPAEEPPPDEGSEDAANPDEGDPADAGDDTQPDTSEEPNGEATTA